MFDTLCSVTVDLDFLALYPTPSMLTHIFVCCGEEGRGGGRGEVDFGGYFSDIVNSLTGGNTSYHTGYRDAGVKNSTQGI